MRRDAKPLKRLGLWTESVVGAHLARRSPRAFVGDRVERILLFGYHGLGNFVLFTAALAALRGRYPHARIDLQIGHQDGRDALVAGRGLIDRVVSLPQSASWSRWVARAAAVRATRYDVTINEFHSQSRAIAWLVAASGAPFRAGHVTSPGWPARLSAHGFAFNLPVVMREDEHEIDRYLDLIDAVGGTAETRGSAPTIGFSDDDARVARELLISGTARPARFVTIQPGSLAAMAWKRWPIERYRALVERLVRERTDIGIAVLGSADEAPLARALADGLGDRVVDVAGRTTLGQAAALIAQCDVLLSNDSGLMHVAAAVGTPVVAIYGPTDLRRTAPRSGRVHVIRHALPCSPCFKLEGDADVLRCAHHDCLMTIEPHEVFDAVLAQLACGSPRRRVQD